MRTKDTKNNIKIVKKINDFDKLKTENKFDDIELQINLIAQVWGQGSGKTRGELKPGDGNKLSFDKAERIVNAFRKEGYEMTQDLVREQQRWHYSRILNSPNITPNHISILENIQVSGFARIDTRNTISNARTETKHRSNGSKH